MKHLKIGITFNAERSMEQLIGESGLNQNVLFYCDLFELLGHEVYALVGVYEDDHFEVAGKTYKVLTATEIIQHSIAFDLIFEGGLSIAQEHRKLMRQRCGARIVVARFGNPVMIDSEYLFVHPPMDKNIHYCGADALWVCPHHARQLGYWENIYHTPAKVAPYIWEPRFMPEPFDDQSLPERYDLISMEPNINVVKCCLMPLLIINQFFLDNPDHPGVGRVRMLNSQEFSDKTYYKSNFLDNLTGLKNHSDIACEGRIRFYEVFTEPHILISWQHINDLNNLYYEALYAGVPLIHNADMHKEVGYYYKDSDIKTAARHINSILQNYDIAREKNKNRALIEAASIYDPVIQLRYSQLLGEAMSQPIRL